MNAFDLALFYRLNGFAGRWPWFDSAVVLFGHTLPYLVGVAFAVLVFLPILPRFRDRFKSSREMLIVAFGGAVIARFAITEIIRYFYSRPRPFEGLNLMHQVFSPSGYLLQHQGGGSFPSGHAVFFFALAAGVWLYDKKIGAVFFLAAALISISRVIGGVHWPSDIVAGLVIALSVAFLMRRQHFVEL